MGEETAGRGGLPRHLSRINSGGRPRTPIERTDPHRNPVRTLRKIRGDPSPPPLFPRENRSATGSKSPQSTLPGGSLCGSQWISMERRGSEKLDRNRRALWITKSNRLVRPPVARWLLGEVDRSARWSPLAPVAQAGKEWVSAISRRFLHYKWVSAKRCSPPLTLGLLFEEGAGVRTSVGNCGWRGRKRGGNLSVS